MNGIKGTIKVFDTPAEEDLIGKTYMNRNGVFDDLDVLIYWHPSSPNNVSSISQSMEDRKSPCLHMSNCQPLKMYSGTNRRRFQA